MWAVRVAAVLALASYVQAFMPIGIARPQTAGASARILTPSIEQGLRVPVAVDVMVSVGEEENIDNAVKRFKREVNKSGHLIDLRFHRYHETTQEKAKRKAIQSRRKVRMARQTMKRQPNNPTPSAATATRPAPPQI